MKSIRYTGPLADRLSAFVVFRRSLGYELRSQVYVLRQFDRVVAREMPDRVPVYILRRRGIRMLSGLTRGQASWMITTLDRTRQRGS